MFNINLAQAAHALGTSWEEGEEIRITGISTDSRSVKSGDLFFCLEGKNFDGHAFARDAAKKGVAAIVASRPLPELGSEPALFVVRDTLTALGDMGKYQRGKTTAKVVAVTGSAGKTTTKEMLAAMLAKKQKSPGVGKNYKNFNNLIGVPKAICSFTGNEAYWVMELGINSHGEMEQLAAIAKPDIAVITNVGPVHLEGLHDIKGVAKAKTKLLEELPEEGKAFVSLDHPELWQEAVSIFPGVTGFSTTKKDAPYFAGYLESCSDGTGRFEMILQGERTEFTAPFVGRCFAENIIAAASVAHSEGVGAESIIKALGEVHIPEHRFSVKKKGTWTIIDDSYNANPLAMQEAIKNAKALAGQDPLVLVLGEMKELGNEAGQLHYELGIFMATTAVGAVFWHGSYGKYIKQGLDTKQHTGIFKLINDPAHIVQHIEALKLSKGTILVKGSRSCAMERYAVRLTGDKEGDCYAL